MLPIDSGKIYYGCIVAMAWTSWRPDQVHGAAPRNRHGGVCWVDDDDDDDDNRGHARVVRLGGQSTLVSSPGPCQH
jgi:hypothetical protein